LTINNALVKICLTQLANFVNAVDSREIVLTRNATEAINLVAYSRGLSSIKQGDEAESSISYLPIKCFTIYHTLLLMFPTICMIQFIVKIVTQPLFGFSQASNEC
jgi:hypothetical protein